jgi:CDP-diacylglycerol--glycerol-3-phosphate 3-phosphatidyltransferase/cardiolipin synthase
MTFANLITFSRIFLIIPVIYLTSLEKVEFNFLALIFFLLAGLTDYLDGYVARKTNTKSSLGALLDLLADKLLVCLTLVWLITLNNSLIFVIPVLIIVLRELSISSIRQYIVEIDGINNLEVSYVGKSKTTIQFVAISLIIISPGINPFFTTISIIFLWLASFMSLLSLYRYLVAWNKFFN